jgi:hypothetical protein
MTYTLYGIMPIWLAKIIEGISYKPGWSLAVVAHNNFGGYEPDAYSIMAQCTVNDVVTKTPISLHGPGITIYKEQMDEKMIIHMIFNSIRSLENHEMEEQFSYNGHRVFDPHRSITENEKIFELAQIRPELQSKDYTRQDSDLTNPELVGFRRLLPEYP